jgi:hypothetical protein
LRIARSDHRDASAKTAQGIAQIALVPSCVAFCIHLKTLRAEGVSTRQEFPLKI